MERVNQMSVQPASLVDAPVRRLNSGPNMFRAPNEARGYSGQGGLCNASNTGFVTCHFMGNVLQYFPHSSGGLCQGGTSSLELAREQHSEGLSALDTPALRISDRKAELLELREGELTDADELELIARQEQADEYGSKGQQLKQAEEFFTGSSASRRSVDVASVFAALLEKEPDCKREAQSVLLDKNIFQCEKCRQNADAKITLFQSMTEDIYKDRLRKEREAMPPEFTCASVLGAIVKSAIDAGKKVEMSEADRLAYLTPDERREYERVLAITTDYCERVKQFQEWCAEVQQHLKIENDIKGSELIQAEESRESLIHEWSHLSSPRGLIYMAYQALLDAKADDCSSGKTGESEVLAAPASKKSRKVDAATQTQTQANPKAKPLRKYYKGKPDGRPVERIPEMNSLVRAKMYRNQR